MRASILLCQFLFLVGFHNIETLRLVGKVTKEYHWTVPEETTTSPNFLTQKQAAELCNRHGMVLASVKNVEEQAVIQNIAEGKSINGNQGYNFWLSGNYREGTWFWNDGTPIQFNRWMQAWGPQPSNSTERLCMWTSPTYWASGGWFDHKCSISDAFRPLCEKIIIEYLGTGY